MKKLPLWFVMLLLGACSVSGSQPDKGHDETLQALQTLARQQDAPCNQAIDVEQQQFIIGYGSLMQDASRQRTAANAGSALAVDVSGFRRGWFASGSNTGFSTTFLGAVPDKNASFNAVIFAISQEELPAMDQRERGYCRIAVQTDRISALASNTALPAGQYWIYSNTMQGIALPDQQKPLVQSYVDIFLGGCLEQEERYRLPGFARRCISSTSDWSSHWVNDRIYPRRPFIHQPRAAQIDRLLGEVLPGLFQQIRLE